MNALKLHLGRTKLDGIIGQLLTSPNPCDQRKGRDLSLLLKVTEEHWCQQLSIMGCRAGDSGYLGVVCCIQVKGLVWGNELPVVRDTFQFVLSIPTMYPLVLPAIQFVRPIPYNPHVVHPQFLPQTTGLPADLQEYAKLGAGFCCFLRQAQWSVDLSCHLSLAVWQLSRILTLSKFFGESVSLNRHARDFAIKLQKQGELPLGPALCLPDVAEGALPCLDGEAAEQEKAIDWITS